MADQGPSKRRKVANDSKPPPSTPLTSLNRDISPPPRAKGNEAAKVVESYGTTDDIVLSQRATRMITEVIDRESPETIRIGQKFQDESTKSDTEDEETVQVARSTKEREGVATSTPSRVRVLPSPIQLTRIRDLPSSNNIDTVSLRDLIGDPMIKECWQFNFLLDLDFIM
jgi:hypothetical protein